MVNLDYLYNPAATKPIFDRDYFIDKKLSFQIIENGTILPYQRMVDGKRTANDWGFGGIIDRNEKLVNSTHVYAGIGLSYTPPQNQLYTVPELSFTSACFIALGDTQLLTTSAVSGF